MKPLLPLLLLLAAAARSQSPLTTLYAGGNGLPGGDVAVYFDLDVHVPVQIHRLDVNVLGGTGAGAIECFTCATTWVGNDLVPAAWTLRGSGPVAAAAPEGTPTPVPMTSSFTLPAGPIGMAVVYRGTLGPSYTNGNGVNQTWAVTELTLQAGASGGVFTGAVNQPRVWNGALHFTVAGGVVATRTNYGIGCPMAPASFYERFATAAAFDLQHSGLSLLPQAGGYLATSLQTTFVPPAPGAQQLVLGDDTETSVTLAAPFAFPGGSTTSLVVCSNGFVSAGSGNGQGYAPSPAALLAMPLAVWSCWHDYNPSFPGSGQVKFEQGGGIARITWDGVLSYAGVGAGTRPSTLQFQFDLGTGAVHFVFGTMDLVGGSAYGDEHVVGYSPGGPSQDPGGSDLSVQLAAGIALRGADLLPLALGASARPIAGSTITLDTANIPANTPFGGVLLGTTRYLPGIDLTSYGMPGCRSYADGLVTLLFVAPGTSASVPVTIPNATGFSFLAQSVAYAPQAMLTPLGAISSNGTELFLGNL